MNYWDLEEYMRGFMIDKNKVPQSTYIVIHVDGDNFSKYTENIEKPFDENFHQTMVETGKELHRYFNSMVSYVQFDEMSIVLGKDRNYLNRNIGKLISKATSLATVKFNQIKDKYGFNGFKEMAMFGTHIFMLPTYQDLLNYLSWRRKDCIKNSCNMALHWALVHDGLSPNKAADKIEGWNQEKRIKLLKEFGINFEELNWRFGTILFWEVYKKSGIDPFGKTFEVERRRVETINAESNIFDELFKKKDILRM